MEGNDWRGDFIFKSSALYFVIVIVVFSVLINIQVVNGEADIALGDMTVTEKR